MPIYLLFTYSYPGSPSTCSYAADLLEQQQPFASFLYPSTPPSLADIHWQQQQQQQMVPSPLLALPSNQQQHQLTADNNPGTGTTSDDSNIRGSATQTQQPQSSFGSDDNNLDGEVEQPAHGYIADRATSNHNTGPSIAYLSIGRLTC